MMSSFINYSNIFSIIAATLSISGPEPTRISEPEAGTTNFSVTVTLLTQGGDTLGSMLEVCLEDGNGSASMFHTSLL